MSDTWLIAGLGNPGNKYAYTWHNSGFLTLEMLAERNNIRMERTQFHALFGKGKIGGHDVFLMKPQTFMNLSGESVAPVVKYHNATAADLVVVQDDIDLAVGKLRIRKAGSCGGHNGIRNIIERLGTQAFVRIKLGVGKDKSNVVGHVLGKFDPETRTVMDRVVEAAAKAVASVISDGSDKAMNAYNGFDAKIPV